MRIRNATIEDAMLLFKWANDETVRAQSISINRITWEEHLSWLTKMLKSDSILLILEDGGQPIAQIRFDYDVSENYWIVNYSVDIENRGKGIGKTIVKYGVEYVNKFPIVAFVRPSNKPSIRIFVSLDFKNTGIVKIKDVELLRFIKGSAKV